MVIRAGVLHGYDILVQTLGMDPAALLHHHGIESNALQNPETLIPLEATIQLLEDSAIATRCPDFGLRLGESQDAGVLGLLAIAIQHAANVAQAIMDASRYLFLHGPAYAVVLEEHSPMFDDCALLRFGIHTTAPSAQRQILDACVATIYRMSLLIGVPPSMIKSVSLPHMPLAPDHVYRNLFGAPIHFAQYYAGIHVQRSALKKDLIGVSSQIRQLAQDYISWHVPTGLPLLKDRVKRTLMRTLGTGRGTKAEIAGLLLLHPRTLQRRLEREGAKFEDLHEEIYREAALHYLRQTDIPFKQVAGMLGYSEHSAFSRACHRWFGLSPKAIRHH